MADPLTSLCPAKVNLYLHVHGLREDGFHELSSLVVPLNFGDTLTLTPVSGADTLVCDQPHIPNDHSNLVLRAAEAFREHYSCPSAYRFELTKRTPVGAGLGGGSSDAATALRLLNQLAGSPASNDTLKEIAASVGSDCPLFLEQSPVFISGRGERLHPVSDSLRAWFRQWRITLFKPHFGIPTPWAYQQLKAKQHYSKENGVNLAKEWNNSPQSLTPADFVNTFEYIVCNKYRALNEILKELRTSLNTPVGMSGSGSTCFALFQREEPNSQTLHKYVRKSLGKHAFVLDTEFL